MQKIPRNWRRHYIFGSTHKSIAEMEEYCAPVDGPKMANMLEGGKTPILSNVELQNMGYSIAVRAYNTAIGRNQSNARRFGQVEKRWGYKA